MTRKIEPCFKFLKGLMFSDETKIIFSFLQDVATHDYGSTSPAEEEVWMQIYRNLNFNL